MRNANGSNGQTIIGQLWSSPMRIRVTSDPRTAVGWWAFGLEVPERKKSSSSMGIYHLVMTHIAMENHQFKVR